MARSDTARASTRIKSALINGEEADKVASPQSSLWLTVGRVIRLMHGMLEISAYMRLRPQQSYIAEMN